MTFQHTDENGNTITNETTYSTSTSTGTVRDLWFTYENRDEDLPEVYFDMDGDGFAENMQKWTKTDEWILVKDTNGDGIINNGKEIVGTHMLLGSGKYANDSYSAMSTFDSNNDGVLDASDNSGLAFWMDKNHNGKTDAGELETLGDVGAVQRIKL